MTQQPMSQRRRTERVTQDPLSLREGFGREDVECWLHGPEALGGHMAPKSLVRCLDGMDLNDQWPIYAAVNMEEGPGPWPIDESKRARL